MGSEIEITETPNWLKELEAKRERRLKTKLGHELGAGAPCLTCEDKCPGLDLHFWRKICKNCKCSKENHEVQDDDIYGWAQDELLGTKVNRSKRKFVLPGRKDEVELEWAPNGQKETIDKYLKTLPQESLPIKGSQAAQDRKQLLKKQIPIHDIDPTLCHELTDEELKKMQEYIAHIKECSVGVGHLIQINVNKGISHMIDNNDAMFLRNNIQKNIATSDNVTLQNENNSIPLRNFSNKLNNLSLTENSKWNPTTESNEHPIYSNIHDRHTIPQNNANVISQNEIMEDIQIPKDINLRSLNYPEQSFNQTPSNKNYNYKNSNIKNLVPSAFVPIKQSTETINNDNDNSYTLDKGTIKELPYPSQFINDKLKYGKNLPNYSQKTLDVFNENQNPAYFQPIKDVAYFPNQNNDKSMSPLNVIKPLVQHNQGDISNSPSAEYSSNGSKIGSEDQHKIPLEKGIIDEINQKPTKFRNIRDLAYSTYDSPQDNNAFNLSVKDRLNMIKKGELPQFRPNNIPPVYENSMSPTMFSIKDEKCNTPSEMNQKYRTNPWNQNVQDLQNEPHLSGRQLPVYQHERNNTYEEELQPCYIPIGSIKDIEYQDPEIRTALSKDNEMFEGLAPNKFLPNLNSGNLPNCHLCKLKFEQDELAIAIPERSEAIFHTSCFKCYGCNQILADMFYFYDKETENIYCGRDYAKIRGVPRCRACDELIFVKEYCLAENSTFHVKHFCCFECDKPLAGQNYVMENDQPVCVPCYELTKANKCYACKDVIHPDQQGLQLKDGVHFHATDNCFACKICRKSLFGAKLLFRNDSLYCSHDCYNSDL